MTNDEFEPVRIRIMKEAYDLADRNDAEGFNSVKVMCGEVQTLLQREWVGLTDEDIKDIVGRNDSGDIGAYTRKMFKQIEDKLREKNRCPK